MLKIVYPTIGGMKICDIKPITLENLAAKLWERVSRGHRIGEGTVQKYMETVSAVLQDAVRNDILPYNPAHRLRLPKVEPRQQIIPTKEELLRLLDAVTREPTVFRVYYTLAILTGMRRGELAALRWNDIEDHHIKVSRSRSQVTGVGIVEGKTKNGKTRFVPLHREMHHMLTNDLIDFYIYDHLEQSLQEHPLWPSDHIFVDKDRRPYHPDTFSKRFRRLLDANGFERRYHLHTMRHFLASFLLNDGISNKVVADLLGHRDTSFLEKTYGHPLAEYGADAANCVAGLLQSGADGKAFTLFEYDGDKYWDAGWDDEDGIFETHWTADMPLPSVKVTDMVLIFPPSVGASVETHTAP